MSSTNQSPEFIKAQKGYLLAQTDEERVIALEEMLKFVPKHKAGESMRANLKTRYKKLKLRLVKKKKNKKGGKEGIKKQGTQIILIGLTNSGKSTLLSKLTNAEPRIADYDFTTKVPLIGTLNYQGISFQIIDMPAINYETFDQGLTNTSDILLIVITKAEELDEILPLIKKTTGKKIIAFNKADLLDQNEKRKVEARLRSKKHQFIIISCKTGEGLDELREKLIENSGLIRIYTKEPRKQKSPDAVTMPENSTVKDIAKKIFGKKEKIKEVKITGPSSKFSNQKVSITHKLKDKDVIEFYVE